MRILVNLLLFAAMFARGILGCSCSYFGNDCCRLVPEQSIPVICSHGGDHRCASVAVEQTTPPSPPHDHVCSCRAEYRYLPVLRVRLDKPQSNPLSLADPRTQAPGFAIIAKAGYDRDFASKSAAPPVRLHLSYQILLI